MKAVRKIIFQIELRTGETAYYTADGKHDFLLKVAALKKHHGPGNVRVVKGSIKNSKVLTMVNNGRTTVFAKAG